jgi:hypothetical protein
MIDAAMREFGTADTLPSDVLDLCRQIGDIPGTDLPHLLQTISANLTAADHILRDLIAQVIQGPDCASRDHGRSVCRIPCERGPGFCP